MSKAYELISASLNEIISDLEENDGKNLRSEVVEVEKISPQIVSPQNKARYQAAHENNIQIGETAFA